LPQHSAFAVGSQQVCCSLVVQQTLAAVVSVSVVAIRSS
jgi:hypothetical protein